MWERKRTQTLMPQFASPHISYDFLQTRLIQAKFHPIGAGVGYGAQKLIILPKFSHINTPQGVYPSGTFYQIFTVCGQLHLRSCIKVWADLLKGFRSYRGLSLGVCASDGQNQIMI